MHQPTLNVSVEQVGHGGHCAVAQVGHASGHATLPCAIGAAIVVLFLFATVIQKVHEEGEIPGKYTKV